MRKIFLALVALAGSSPAWAGGPPTAPPVPSCAGPSATDGCLVGNAPLPVAAPPRWTAVSRRAQFGGFNLNNVTVGYRKGYTSRLWEQTPAGAAISAIRLVYSSYVSGTSQVPATSSFPGEAPSANPVTCTASVESDASSLTNWNVGDANAILSPPVTFGGAPSFTLPVAATVVSDPISLYLPPNGNYYIRTYCNEPIAGKIPIRAYTGSNFDGTDIGFTTAVFGTGNGSQTVFNFTAAANYQPVVPGSIQFAIPGFSTVADNGSGGCASGNGVASCAINYTTGSIQITTSAAVANGSAIRGWLVGGAAEGDQTQVSNMVNFSSVLNGFNQLFGPVAVLGLPVYGNRERAIAIFGDSIIEGFGNTNTINDTSWLDYSARTGGFGVWKGAIDGLQLQTDADPRGRRGRVATMIGVDRIIDDAATNDFSKGQSLSQIVNNLLQTAPVLAGLAPHGAADVWWVAMLPRVTAHGATTPYAVSAGPYTAAGAAYGPGAVNGGVQSCTITGSGIAGPYSCNFAGATMIGSLWSDGAYTTVVDSGAGGTAATTLSGSQVSTGTHTPATGAVSLTFSAALPLGQAVNLYAYLTGPSERNAWNHMLFNWAVPNKLIGGVIDAPACVELVSGSATGSGDGLWASSTYEADGTHPSALGHQTVLPACLGPGGATPSQVWTFP